MDANQRKLAEDLVNEVRNAKMTPDRIALEIRERVAELNKLLQYCHEFRMVPAIKLKEDEKHKFPYFCIDLGSITLHTTL